METKTKRMFEVMSILLLSFVIISLVFFGVQFGLKQTKIISGNVIESDVGIRNSLEWVFITIVASLIIIAILEYVIRRNVFKIRWNLKFP